MHGKRISKSPKIFYQHTPKGRPHERWKELYWEPQFRCNNAGRSTFTVRVNQYNWTNGSPSDWCVFRIPEFCCTFKLCRMLKISYSDLPAFHNSVSMPACIRHHSSFHKEDEHEIKEINQRIHLTTQADVCFQQVAQVIVEQLHMRGRLASSILKRTRTYHRATEIVLNPARYLGTSPTFKIALEQNLVSREQPTVCFLRRAYVYLSGRYFALCVCSHHYAHTE
jgi:hypothetical protein